MKINERSHLIINLLIKADDFLTVTELAKKLNVSNKTITRELDSISVLLGNYDVLLERKAGVGIRLIANPAKINILKNLLTNNSMKEYAPNERHLITLIKLLKSQEPIKIYALSSILKVSDATISNDLDKIEHWLKDNHLILVRKPGLGIYVDGTERDIRKAIVSLLYKNTNDQELSVLLDESTETLFENEIKNFLLELVDKDIIHRVHKAINNFCTKAQYNLSQNTLSGLLVHLTLAMQRLLKKEVISIDENLLAKLQSKNAYKLANNMAEELREVFNIEIPEAEQAYITMHLLGSRNEYLADSSAKIDNFRLIKIAKNIVDITEVEIGIKIGKKNKLIVDLVKHLGPAITRLKLQLEIRNPLLEDMQKKYPHWMALAEKASLPLVEALNLEKLPAAEIGYLAMHIGSAIEESMTKKDTFNVIISCPTGIGTSRLVATQIKKYFNNINIASIVPVENIPHVLAEKRNIDFIISSVPIEETAVPNISVNYILSEEDIKNINKMQNMVSITQQDEYNSEKAIPLTEQLNQISNYADTIEEVLTNFKVYENIEIDSLEELYVESSKLICNDKNVEKLAQELSTREMKGHTIFQKIMLLHTKSSEVGKLHLKILHLAKALKVDNSKIKAIILIVIPSRANDIQTNVMSIITGSLVQLPTLIDSVLHGNEEGIFGEIEQIYKKFFFDKVIEIKGGTSYVK